MAQDINDVTLIGRLTRDLGSDERSFGYTQSGVARASIDIAVNRSKKQGDQWIEEVSYFTVLLWGKNAENLKPYLTKGKQICVRGFLKQERWEKDGQKNSRVVIVSEQCQLLGGNSENQNNYTQQQSQYAQQYQNQQNDYQQSGTPQFRPAHQNQQQPVNNASFPEDIPWGSNDQNDIPF